MTRMPPEPVGPVYFAEPPPPAPEPTPAQLARAEALRRFNRRYVYVPLIIMAILWFIVVLGMLWVSLVGDWFYLDTDQEFYRTFFSALADLTLITWVSFLMLICMLPIGIAGYVYNWRRQREKTRPPGPRPLPLMWRLENIVDTLRSTSSDVLPKLANPVITAHAAASYVKALLREIKRIVTRS